MNQRIAGVLRRSGQRLLCAGIAVAALAGEAGAQLPPEAQRALRQFGAIRVIAEVKPASVIPGLSATMSSSDLATATVQAGDLISRRASAIAPGLVSATVNGSGYLAMMKNPNLARVYVDRLSEPSLQESAPLVEAPTLWGRNIRGEKVFVAVLDTGVDTAHPALKSHIAHEACFSSSDASSNSESACPNGGAFEEGPGTARPCASKVAGCDHGTHVAGIVASSVGSISGKPISGIAPNAGIVAIQVFSVLNNADVCRSATPCARSWTSDQIKALQYVKQLARTRQIVAVNMSLGVDTYEGQCDQEPMKTDIDQLVSVGIPTIVAAGNDGRPNRISSPACISSAISVGATDDRNQLAEAYTNRSRFLSLVAPGDQILSTVPGGGYAIKSGTSMATPHVAAAWSLIRQTRPQASVAEVLSALKSTGLPVKDRATNAIYSRIRLAAAADEVLKAGTSSGTIRAVPAVTSGAGERLEKFILTSGAGGVAPLDVVNDMGASAPRGSVVYVERLPGDSSRFSVTAPASTVKALQQRGFGVARDALSAPQ